VYREKHKQKMAHLERSVAEMTAELARLSADNVALQVHERA
jgi:hypothetical protein